MRVQPFAQGRERGTLDYRDMLATELRGRIGRSAGFGKLRFGAANFGDTRKLSGIYQGRRLSKDPSRYDPVSNPRYPFITMRTYRPTYANTEIQEENRGKFAAAVEFWQGLTDDEKAIYNERGAKRRVSGYNVCISDFMRYYDEAP